MIDRVATLDTVLGELGATSPSPPAFSAAAPRSPVNAETPAIQESGMDPKILTALIRAGLCGADATKEQATIALQAFFIAKGIAMSADPAAIVAALTPTAAAIPAPVVSPTLPPTSPAASAMAVEDICASVQLTALPAERKLSLQAELLKERATLSTAQVLDRINKAAAEVAKPTGAATIAVTADAVDKFRVAARDALLVREYGSANLPKQIFDMRMQSMRDWQPESRRDYTLSSLKGLAEECLILSGISAQQIRSLAPADIARIVMGKPLSDFGIFAGDPLFNVSGMFSNILLDAQNVILRRSYTEANTTFQVWMRNAESIADFKLVNKVIAGELSDPKAIPEDGEFEETTMTDGKESYKLVVWGEVWSATWQMIVNDRLQAFTEIPAKQGRAMRRKQNKLAYGVLLDNANLADGNALFSAAHGNNTTGVNPPTVANLNTIYQKMAVQTGISNQTVLGLEPYFLIGPPALRGTFLQLLGSMSDPASNNANVKNIWQNVLQPVVDAQLSAAVGGSDVQYYAAARSEDVDTIEYAYLQGLESPAMDMQVAFDRLGTRNRIYQAFAVKALDFRGLQRQVGA
jgi:hypothetical protein